MYCRLAALGTGGDDDHFEVARKEGRRGEILDWLEETRVSTKELQDSVIV